MRKTRGPIVAIQAFQWRMKASKKRIAPMAAAKNKSVKTRKNFFKGSPLEGQRLDHGRAL
jgi:hypothetical protein